MAVSTVKAKAVVKSFTKAYTVSANDMLAVNFDISQSGLTPISISGYDTGHGSCAIVRAQIMDDSTARLGIRNLFATSVSSTATIIVEYI